MSSGRHKQKVERAPRRVKRLLLPAAGAALVTGTIVGVSVAVPHGEQVAATSSPSTSPSSSSSPSAAVDSTYLADRESLLSRSADRATLKALPKVTDHQVMVAPLNVWPAPREHGDPLDVLPVGTRVAVTGVERDGFAQVLIDRQVRWVNADYLQDHLPKPSPTETPSTGADSGATSTPSTGGVLSSAACASGSSVESGLVPNAVALHRAVCAHFPQVSEYGGYRPDGEHADGHALDIMVYSDSATGQAIADWVRANASTLHVEDVIWAQHIWTPVRASEGWRLMPDRGSTTANHYDHVHVQVY